MSATTPWILGEAASADGPPALTLAPQLVEDPAGASLVVARWFRYGIRRLYVTTAEGAEVGWADVDTGDRVLKIPELEAAFEAAVDLEIAGLPPVYTPRRVLAEAPPSIAPRRAIVPGADVPPSPVSLPAGETVAPGRAVTVVVPPPFPQLTWADLAVGGRDAATDTWVASRLEELRAEGWQVLHSVPLGARGLIDHVLIGPGGVYVLNSDPDPAGRPRDLRYEADRAAKFLSGALGWSVEVTPAVMVHTDADIAKVAINGTPHGMVVLDRLDLPRYFRNRQPRLTQAEVADVHEYARRSSTWA